MMMNQPPPDLFPERPVRSEYASGLSYRARRIITLTVLMSVLIGAAYMGFGRDHTQIVAEEVPVIKAAGSYKQRPQEPGGLDIPHQDVDVYNEMDARTSALPVTERLLPAAEMPRSEQLAVPFTAADADAVPAAQVENLAELPSTMPVLNDDKSLLAVDGMLNDLSPASAMPLLDTVLNKKSEVDKLPEVNPLPVVEAVEVEKEGGMIQSPSVVVEATKNTIAKSAPPQSVVNKKDPASIKETTIASSTKGSVIVQLASVQGEDAAQKTLEQLQSKYSSILGGTRLHLVRADLGAKGVYYRIQGAAMTSAHANAVCGELKKINAGCLIVR